MLAKWNMFFYVEFYMFSSIVKIMLDWCGIDSLEILKHNKTEFNVISLNS